MSPKRPSPPPLPLPAEEPAPMSDPALSAPPAPAAANAPAMPPPQWKVQTDPKEAVRRFGLVLALVFLAISLAVAYYSANSILSIWFEYQYTPIVRLVMALGVAGLALWVVMRLTQRR